jgi:DNA-binding IclR family transcriptional regulator
MECRAISVLTNAVNVLRCIGTDCPDLTVSEVARRLDMPKANASRLLKAMREAGMLETIGTSRRHRPGSLLLYVGSLQRHSSVLIGKASEAVASVCKAFGHTGYVSMLDGREVVGVADFEGTNALRVVSNIGRRLSAHRCATGRALLARMPDDKVCRLYDGHSELADLRKALRVIHEQGFAISSQESAPGVDAIAIAVGDPKTSENLSLCIVYPHGHVDHHERGAITAALADHAAQIAAELGDTHFVAPKTQQKEIQ